MGEFKDFKREEDPSLEQPLNERAFLPKNFTRDQLKRYKRYLEIAKRYKEHKFKPRKNNDPRTKDFFIIKSEKKIKKYHLDDLKEFLVEDADDDEADDTIK